MSDFAQTVKQQADIVRIIGEYITLKKSGAQNYSGLCPFHGEKTPSFSVHVTRQFYHCFGCGVSGDVFKFVQEIDKVSFPEAVKIVAQKCGIALPKREFSSPEEAAESRLRGRLLELYEQATLWFEEQLKSPEGARAREYLTGRGLKPETIAKFRIGYAPDGFGGLRERLAGAAPPDVLRNSGLFRFKEQEDETGNKNAGRIYDCFRKRITFPICERGRPGDCVYGAGARFGRSRGSTSTRRRRRCIPRGRCCSTWTRRGRRSGSRIWRCWWRGRWTASPSLPPG